MIESPRVIIRADGGGRFGLGHVMRGLAMAESLRSQGADVSFLMADIPDCPAERVRSRGFGVEVVAPDVLEHGWRSDEPVDILWIDHHEIDIKWQSPARKWARIIGVIDDLGDRSFDCDLVVSPAPRKGGEEFYREMVPSAQLLLGPAYTPLEKRFEILRPKAPLHEPSRRIIVSFGGADQKNQTCKVLEGLESIPGPLDITVVVGGLNTYREAVEQASSQSAHRVVVRVDVDDMASLWVEHDLAIGAAGDSAFERCCLGIPAVVIVCAENQETVAAFLKDEKAGVVLGWWEEVKANDVAKGVSALLEEKEHFRNISYSAWSSVDGGGADRVSEQLLSLLLVPESVKRSRDEINQLLSNIDR